MRNGETSVFCFVISFFFSFRGSALKWHGDLSKSRRNSPAKLIKITSGYELSNDNETNDLFNDILRFLARGQKGPKLIGFVLYS